MSADVSFNLLNKWRKRDKISCAEHFVTLTTGTCRSGSALFCYFDKHFVNQSPNE